MKDRQAPRKRPLMVGIPARPQNGIPMDDGVEMNKGVPRGPESVYGIPTGPVITREKGPAKCAATTKSGAPCKAFATGTGKCAGHSRL